MSCGVGRRCGSDLALPWLWYRPAAAVLIGPLAWEPPHAMGATLKDKKTKKIKKIKFRILHNSFYSPTAFHLSSIGTLPIMEKSWVI